jgi:hypothetical protein
LRAAGGFDEQFRIAGDDVDLCWRLSEMGGSIGFHPAAVVFHHRRDSGRGYWRQQLNYGRAEALLERKWPARYNTLGHVTWHGRMYGAGLSLPLWLRQRVYHGVMGMAPFQSLGDSPRSLVDSIYLMPEWYLLLAFLGFLSIAGLVWAPLLWALPVLGMGCAVSITQGIRSARNAGFQHSQTARLERLQRSLLTTMLHLLQPAARLIGRFAHGARSRRRPGGSLLPREQSRALWMEKWKPPEQYLFQVMQALQDQGVRVGHGGPYDRWDLEVPGGLLGRARLLMAVEDHGAGTQYVRTRIWPHWTRRARLLAGVLTGLALAAAVDASWAGSAALALAGLAAGLRTSWESGIALDALARGVSNLEGEELPRDGLSRS